MEIKDWEEMCEETAKSLDWQILGTFVLLENLLDMGEREIGYKEFLGKLKPKERDHLERFKPYFKKARDMLIANVKI